MLRSRRYMVKRFTHSAFLTFHRSSIFFTFHRSSIFGEQISCCSDHLVHLGGSCSGQRCQVCQEHFQGLAGGPHHHKLEDHLEISQGARLSSSDHLQGWTELSCCSKGFGRRIKLRIRFRNRIRIRTTGRDSEKETICLPTILQCNCNDKFRIRSG